MMANSPRSKQVRPAQKTTQGSVTEQHRQKRLNKALRENLLKRKQQTRSRQQQQIMPKGSSAGQGKGKEWPSYRRRQAPASRTGCREARARPNGWHGRTKCAQRDTGWHQRGQVLVGRAGVWARMGRQAIYATPRSTRLARDRLRRGRTPATSRVAAHAEDLSAACARHGRGQFQRTACGLK